MLTKQTDVPSLLEATKVSYIKILLHNSAIYFPNLISGKSKKRLVMDWLFVAFVT